MKITYNLDHMLKGMVDSYRSELLSELNTLPPAKAVEELQQLYGMVKVDMAWLIKLDHRMLMWYSRWFYKHFCPRKMISRLLRMYVTANFYQFATTGTKLPIPDHQTQIATLNLAVVDVWSYLKQLGGIETTDLLTNGSPYATGDGTSAWLHQEDNLWKNNN